MLSAFFSIRIVPLLSVTKKLLAVICLAPTVRVNIKVSMNIASLIIYYNTIIGYRQPYGSHQTVTR